jgi:hypothetical protein
MDFWALWFAESLQRNVTWPSRTPIKRPLEMATRCVYRSDGVVVAAGLFQKRMYECSNNSFLPVSRPRFSQSLVAAHHCAHRVNIIFGFSHPLLTRTARYQMFLEWSEFSFLYLT